MLRDVKILSSFFFSLLLLVSCSKNSGSGGGGGDIKQFLANSQWVGVLSQNGYQYAPPASIRFKPGDSLVIYAPFYLTTGAVSNWRDSLRGKVTAIDEMADGKTVVVKTSLEHFGDVELNFTDRKTVTANAPDPTNPNRPLNFQMEIYGEKNFSLENTLWSGPIMTGAGPTQGLPAYPDLSAIGFGKNYAYYMRNGTIVPEQPTPQIPTPGELKIACKQVGAVVFMFGYNENVHAIIPYMGVLLPDNKRMMVFSSSGTARLPNYLQTIAWYGPIGQTPIIEKK
jgi:hypothetical protein